MRILNAEHRHQIEVGKRQAQQQAFSLMTGQKFLVPQLYVSRFEALIFSDYHEALWKLEGYPEESLNFQETQRWMLQSEGLVMKIAKNNKTLFETIGLITILFTPRPELNDLIDKLYHFKTPVLNGPIEGADRSQLQDWKTNAVKQLQDLVQMEYAKPIEDLLTYLSNEIAH
jgi:hypothetical protein